jgi:glycosyltransferase involved in cell wall biosynthesis
MDRPARPARLGAWEQPPREACLPAAERPYLSVVVPAYNESENLQQGALDKVVSYLGTRPYRSELLVVDDGSEDDTADLAERYAASHAGVRVLRNPHRGKAHTVVTGLLAAEGELILFTDMDQATPIREVERLLPWFDEGYDLVIGSRGTVRRNAPLSRRLMSRGQVVLRDVVLDLGPVTDTQCGFKAFRRGPIRQVVERLAVYDPRHGEPIEGAAVTAGFDVELLFIAHRLGFRVKEVPVEWDYQRTRRVNLFRDSLRGVRDLLRIRLADARGAYGG